MPASYTHICIARDTLGELTTTPAPNDFLQKVQGDGQLLAAYIAGAEGPDPLFFALVESKKLNPSPEVGTLIHHKETGRFLKCLIDGARNGDDCLKAYVLGFLTHYGSDTIFHPYVYTHSFSDSGEMISNKHCKFEHVLDIYMHRIRGGKGLPVQMEGFKNLSKTSKSHIADLLAEVIKEVFPENELTKKQILNSFSMGVWFTGLLKRITTRRFSIIYTVAMKTKLAALADSHIMPNDSLESLTKEGDYETLYYTFHNMLNSKHETWHSCFEPEIDRNESVEDLLELAKVRDSSFIKASLAYFEGKINDDELMSIIGNMSYDSGLDWASTPSI